MVPLSVSARACGVLRWHYRHGDHGITVTDIPRVPGWRVFSPGCKMQVCHMFYQRKPARKRRGGWIGPSRHAAHQRANATNRAAWWVDRPILPRRPADLLPATGRSVPSPKRAAWWVDRPILPRRPAGAWEWKYHHGYLLGEWGREIMALPLRPWGPLCQWIHRALCPLLFFNGVCHLALLAHPI